MVPLLLNNLAGAKFKLSSGLSIQSNVQLAMESGGSQRSVRMVVGWRACERQEHDRAGGAKITLDIATKPHAELAAMKVPYLMDLLPEGENKEIIKIILSPQQYSRPFAMPPGVPTARLEAARQAFAGMMQDPEAKAEADKMGLELSYLNRQWDRGL